MSKEFLVLIDGILAFAIIGIVKARIRSLKKEISTMGFTAAQQKAIDQALADNNVATLKMVNDAVAAEVAEIKLDIQRIETKVNEGTVTASDMQGLLSKITGSPDSIKAAVEASIGGISKDTGADDAETDTQP